MKERLEMMTQRQDYSGTHSHSRLLKIKLDATNKDVHNIIGRLQS